MGGLTRAVSRCFVLRAGFGAAYGTAKSGSGIAAIGVMHPELVMRSVLPIIMAGIIGLYGLIVDVMMINTFDRMHYPLFTGALHLGGGLCVGLSGLAAGIAIGVIGDAGVRGVAQQPRLFMGMVLILIFAEVLGLYGMIVALLMNMKAVANVSCS